MSTWNSRGLRGSTLEEFINRSNDFYYEKKLAMVQKIPTPITPIKIDQEKRHITLAYFEQRSTVDYIGAVQGIPICFDAKECALDTFPLSNVHKHQLEFMADYELQKGVSFLIIYYSHKNLCYYMRFEELLKYWTRMEEGGRKSFRFDELDPSYFLKMKNGFVIPYLDGVQKDLQERDF